MLKRLWKDPVWSAVIAAAVLAAAGAVGTYLLDLWPVISQFFASLARTAGEPSQLPTWLFWLVTAFAIPTVVALVALMWSVVRPAESMATWRTYTEDFFLGLRWRWKYFDDGGLRDVVPFCPHCDFQVFPHHASSFVAVERIGFHCDSCGRDLPTFEESYESLESKIHRFIQQRLRRGSWFKREVA